MLMYNHRNVLILIILVTVLFLQIGAVQGADNPQHSELKAFPSPEKNVNRFVIVLPHKTRGEEEEYKVEIIPGKTMLTDGVNQMRLGATVTPRPLKGWGYTYYEVSGSDLTMSTLIAPPEGTEQLETFVAGSPMLIRYNSRLPIVIYAPVGYQIRYRIWQTGKKLEKAPKG
jgi:ecotin